jgi:hypothetical protein
LENHFNKVNSDSQIDHCAWMRFSHAAIWSALTFGNDNYCTRAPESGGKKLIAKCGLIYKIKLSSARDGPAGAGRNENAPSVCVCIYMSVPLSLKNKLTLELSLLRSHRVE